MDVADGFLLADGSHAKALTGIDDPGRAFLAVDSPGNRCQHSCTAWPPRLNRSPHARQS
jgi:hypothetical protein